MAGRSSKSNNRGSSLYSFFVSGKYKEYHTAQFASSSSTVHEVIYTIANMGSEFQIRDTGTVYYKVNWGDGTDLETVTTNNKSHTYSTAGIYVVRLYNITGSYRPYWTGSAFGDQVLMVSIKSGVDLGTNLQSAFNSMDAMLKFVIPFTATSNVTRTNGMFAGMNYLTSSPGYPLFDTSNVTDIQNMFSGYGNPTPTVFGTVPLYDFSEATTAYQLFRDNKFISTIPAFNLSKCTNMALAFYGTTNLTAIPAITLTSLCTSFYRAFSYTQKLTSIAVINTSGVTDFRDAWVASTNSDTYLTSFPALDFSSGTQFQQSWRYRDVLVDFPANLFDSTGTLNSNAFQNAWNGCALTAQSIENILTSLDTNGQSNITLGINGGTNANASTWSTAANTAYNNLVGKGWTITQNGTVVSYEITYTINNSGTAFTLGNAQTVNMDVDWGDGSAVQTVTTNDPSHTYASAGTYQIKLDITGAYMPEFVGTVETQVTAIDIGSTAILGLGNHLTYGSDLYGAFRGMSNMTSFTAASAPFSYVNSFNWTWWGCSSLTTFPVIDTSNGTAFQRCWRQTGIVSFPALDFSSATTFSTAWYYSASLTTFPANVFNSTGTLVTGAFGTAFTGCALTAQSIENILTSLDTNGQSNITLDIDGGTNAAYSTWSTAAQTALTNLTNKGWTVNYNT